MSIIMDRDEIKIIPENNKWKYLYRFANTNISITDGNTYENKKECVDYAIINMALSNYLTKHNCL